MGEYVEVAIIKKMGRKIKTKQRYYSWLLSANNLMGKKPECGGNPRAKVYDGATILYYIM